MAKDVSDAPASAPSARPAPKDGALDLERFAVGLLALLLYLAFEAIDLTIVGFDVLYDGVGALLLFFVARCIDQPGTRRYGAPTWAVWGLAGARLAGAALALPVVSAVVPDVVAGALAVVFLASLVAVALAVRMVCGGRGLQSSSRWLRVTMALALTGLVPAVVGASLGNWPRVGLPLRFSEGEGLVVASTGFVLYIVSFLALVDAAFATFTTMRSARRRA